MKSDTIEQMSDARETTLRIFKSYPPDQAMDLIACPQQKFGEIRTVLSVNAGD